MGTYDIRARTEDGARVTVRHGDTAATYDLDPEVGGQGEHLTPTAGALAALAACTATTLGLYAARKGWPLGPVDVRVRLEPAQGKEPARITQEVVLSGPLDDEQRERLRVIAGRCPVHRLMEGGTVFEERLVPALEETG